MMKQKRTDCTFTIYDDVFCFEIDVYIGKWANFCKWRSRRYPNHSFEPLIVPVIMGGIFHPGCVRKDERHLVGVIWFSEDPERRAIVHEAVHAAAWVCRIRNLISKPIDEDNEVFPCIVAYIVNEICKGQNPIGR